MRKIAIALTIFSGVAAGLFAAAPAQAQTYPSRPITLIVPFPPGGSTDSVARIISERMKQSLGQAVVIENVGGAGGSIAVGRLARAEPDGYTIDIGQWDTHVASIIYPLNYDLVKDFDPIGLVSLNPQLMVGKKTLPADNLKDLVAWMKANPDKITFVNQNASGQLSGILFEKATGQKVQLIPYRGGGPAMADLSRDRSISWSVKPPLRSRRYKPEPSRRLQICRRAVLPPCPNPDIGRSWRTRTLHFRMVRPLRAKGTPKEAITKLNAALVHALAEPAVRKRFTEFGLDVASREQQTRRGGSVPQDRNREMVADHQGRGDRRGTVRCSALRPCQPAG